MTTRRQPDKPTLPTSMALYQWLSADLRWRGLPAGLRARHAWAAGWGSINHALSRALAGQEPAPALAEPWLIVGLWRSGSTVMHELLSAATGLASPTTWQCLHAATLRTSRPSAQGLAVQRPMDGLPLSDASPQEDEFALLSMGVPSAYRGFLMPHRMSELRTMLDPDHWTDGANWLGKWEAFLGDVALSNTVAAQPLILKSPNHTFRLPAILTRFPSSKVVWMTRHPAQVYHSNLKMWRSMFELHGLTEPDDSGLDGFLAEALDRAATMLQWCCTHLDRSQFVVVDHHALQAAPEDTLRRLCDRLRPGQAMDEGRLQRAMQRLQGGRVDQYDAELPPHAQAAADALELSQRRAQVFALRPANHANPDTP
jgi:hypothetical protein